MKTATMSRLMALLLALFVATTSARADDYVCYGYCEFGPDAHFDGNLIVAEGATAVLNGSTVEGNIHVYDRAVLRTDGATVGGNIQSAGAKRITVLRTSVGGSIQLDNGRGPIQLSRNVVEGDIQLFSNNARLGKIQVLRNRVGGNVQIYSNRSAQLVVSYNVIDGNLQGESNSVPPTGTGNRVHGDTDGQFEGF